MKHEILQLKVDVSLEKARRYNEQLAGNERLIVDTAAAIVQNSVTPLTLSQRGLVLTPRVWDQQTKETLTLTANTARTGLLKVSEFLAASEDPLAVGIRRNMLGQNHLDMFDKILKKETENGVSSRPFEVGRADIINGGAIEVNAACLDAPIDFHDLTLFHAKIREQMEKYGVSVGLEAVPEDSIVHLIVDTMLEQREAGRNSDKQILAWIGTAHEIYGARDKGGYWPRELRFKQVANEYLNQKGVNAEFQLVALEQLNEPSLIRQIGSAYRNLLPEDMFSQPEDVIAGLGELSSSGRLVGSITAELITNKASMAVLCSPDFSRRAGIPPSDWKKYASAFPPTAFLSRDKIYSNGDIFPLQPMLDGHRDQLYFKLSNGEEGQGVFPGKIVDDKKLKDLQQIAKSDPYSVIVQVKLNHFPFDAAVVDLSRYQLDVLQGWTDAGTHYQLQNGELGSRDSNIVMTRFEPSNNGVTISNGGKDGIFRPVITTIEK